MSDLETSDAVRVIGVFIAVVLVISFIIWVF